MENRKRALYAIICCLQAMLLFIPFPPGALSAPLSLQNSSITLLRDKEYLPALKEAIALAKKDIVMSYFLFKTKGKGDNYPDVVMEGLMAAAQRGVAVVVLLERGGVAGDSTTADNRRTMGRLKKRGVRVYLDSPKITTHTKMTVVDGRYTFIGSHNLTQSALKYNNEVSVLIESAQVAAEATAYIKSLLPADDVEKR